MVEIKEVITKKELAAFINFPFELYKNDPYWIPPLKQDEQFTFNKEKNPSFEFCQAKYWLAYRNKEVVGRVVAIVNENYNKKSGVHYVRFGWIEFMDDPEVSKALLMQVEKYAREQKASKIHGPLGFSDMDKQGLLIEGYEELCSIITYYHPPYYKEHLERLGYVKDVDWLEFKIDAPKELDPRLSRISAMTLRKYKLHVEALNTRKDLLKWVDAIFGLLNKAYADLYGVAPITDQQIKTYTKQYFSFVNKDFIILIVDKSEKLVGFGVSMPSLSEAFQKANGKVLPFGWVHLLRGLKKSQVLDLYLVAVMPELQGKGIAAVILNESLKAALKHNMKYAIASPELEDNKKVHSMWKFFNTEPFKRRRCYVKDVKS